MINPSSERLIFFSALFALISLALMTSSVVSREALGAIPTMNIGQALGVLSLALYGWAVVRDAKKAKLVGSTAETENR